MYNKIKYMVFDVDGTLTDGKLYIGNNGEVFKVFNVKDGYAIHDILPEMGITPVVLTARSSEIVKRRCEELNIKNCYQGIKNKKEKLLELIEEWKLSLNQNGICEELAYIGDDIVDLPCIEICGFSACPYDAVKKVRDKVDYVSIYKAGDGAVRDIIERYLEYKKEG
ncbi:MAG: KdsC family phosphatase [Lachnospirales bacterium]